YIMGGKAAWPLYPSVAFAIVVIAIVLLQRHSQNIARLLQGKESRIGGSKTAVKTPSGPQRRRRRTRGRRGTVQDATRHATPTGEASVEGAAAQTSCRSHRGRIVNA